MISYTVNGAISYLESLGYKIVKPIKKNCTNITNAKLINLFYDNLEYKFGREFRLYLKENSINDRKALTKIHAKAKKIGLSPKEVNSSIAFSIESMFKHYDSLGLHTCPDSFEFIISSGSWILTKALAIEEIEISNYYNSDEFNNEVDQMCEIPSDLFKIRKEEQHKDLKGIFDNGSKEQN